MGAMKEDAGFVTFVEQNPRHARAIEEATSRFASQRRVESKDAFLFLENARARDSHYDIIFADPPFPLWNPSSSPV